MEWVDGCRLSNEAELRRMDLDSSKLVDTLVECSLRSCNYFAGYFGIIILIKLMTNRFLETEEVDVISFK